MVSVSINLGGSKSSSSSSRVSLPGTSGNVGGNQLGQSDSKNRQSDAKEKLRAGLKGGGSSGGGISGGGSSGATPGFTSSPANQFYTPAPQYTPTPQGTSAKAQSDARDIARANVNNQREALQRDQNYLISNGDLLNKYGGNNTNSFYRSGSSKSPSPYFDNPFKPIQRPTKTGFKFGDIFKALNPYSVSSGTISTAQAQNTLSGGYLNIFGKNVPVPGLIQYKALGLVKDQRNSANELAYQKAKDIQTIQFESIMATPGYGQVGFAQKVSEKDYFSPINIIKNIAGGRKPFVKEYDVTSYPNADFKALEAGLAGKGIKTEYDVNTVEKISMYESPNASGGTDLITETTTNNSYSNIRYTSPALEVKEGTLFMKELKEREKAGKSKVPTYIAAGFGYGGEYIAKGLAFAYGAEALGLPAVAESAAVSLGLKGGGKLLATGIIGTTAFEVGKSSYDTSKSFGEFGLSKTEGAIFGAGVGSVQAAGFLVGASKGSLSPFQVQTFSDTASQEIKGFNAGIVNPFGRSGKSMFNYVKGEGFGFGVAKPTTAIGSIESSGQLGLQMLQKNIGRSLNSAEAEELFSIAKQTLPKTNKLSTPGISTVDISQTKGFSLLNTKAQAEVLKLEAELGSSGGFFKNVGNAFKENVLFGSFSNAEAPALERIFGTTTIKGELGKAFPRQPGDTDFNVFGKVKPYQEAYAARVNLAGGYGPGEGLIAKEGKISINGVKFKEGFGIDIPSETKSPLGFKGQYPKTMKLATGERTVGQKIGESLTQKFGTSLTMNFEKAGLTIGPRAGQEKVIPDIYKMIGGVKDLSPKNAVMLEGLQKRFGTVALKMNPNINLEAGTFGGAGSPIAKANSLSNSLSGFSISKKLSSGLSLSGGSSSSKGFGLSTPSSFSSSSKSSFSVPSFSTSSSSSSFSSFPSSISSKSSRSSRSSSSSSSLSSLSSVSSLSSISSSSSSSLSSLSSSSSSRSSSSSSSRSSSSSSSRSSSRSSSSFSSVYGGFDLPSLGGFALPTPKTRGRNSAFNIAPGFTSIVLDKEISGPIKVSKTFGVSPFTTRGLLKGKNKNKAYFKIVDF